VLMQRTADLEAEVKELRRLIQQLQQQRPTLTVKDKPK
jgi:hypothetical protein